MCNLTLQTCCCQLMGDCKISGIANLCIWATTTRVIIMVLVVSKDKSSRRPWPIDKILLCTLIQRTVNLDSFEHCMQLNNDKKINVYNFSFFRFTVILKTEKSLLIIVWVSVYYVLQSLAKILVPRHYLIWAQMTCPWSCTLPTLWCPSSLVIGG